MLCTGPVLNPEPVYLSQSSLDEGIIVGPTLWARILHMIMVAIYILNSFVCSFSHSQNPELLISARHEAKLRGYRDELGCSLCPVRLTGLWGGRCVNRSLHQKTWCYDINATLPFCAQVASLCRLFISIILVAPCQGQRQAESLPSFSYKVLPKTTALRNVQVRGWCWLFS